MPQVKVYRDIYNQSKGVRWAKDYVIPTRPDGGKEFARGSLVPPDNHAPRDIGNGAPELFKITEGEDQSIFFVSDEWPEPVDDIAAK